MVIHYFVATNLSGKQKPSYEFGGKRISASDPPNKPQDYGSIIYPFFMYDILQ